MEQALFKEKAEQDVQSIINGKITLEEYSSQDNIDYNVLYEVRDLYRDHELKEMNPFNIKFGPGHFRKGTKFVTFIRGEVPEIHTAIGISFSPGQGFVIKTDKVWYSISEEESLELGIDRTPINVSVNISHVRQILDGGNGPSLLSSNTENNDHLKNLKEKDEKLERESLPFLRETVFGSSDSRQIVSWTGIRRYLLREVDRIDLPIGQVVDYDRLVGVVMSQTFIRTIKRSEEYPFRHFTVIDKKRLRKFVKKNINRFLMSSKQLRKLNDEIERELYERELREDVFYG